MNNSEWKVLNIDGKKSLVRKAEMQSDLIAAIKAHMAALPRGNGKIPEGDA